ncbi:MAG: ABC transporter permease [Streptococcaceae bacterium]|jgi:simple sugar transport system permease protein|nr:ABC transporter permease [Streptococcaceae bacterium]
MTATQKKIIVPIIVVLAGFILGAIIMLAFGYNPIYGYEDLFTTALGTPRAIGNTLNIVGPLVLTALGFATAMKVGLFNIGMSGQALAGWFAAVWFTLAFKGIPSFLLIPMLIIVGMLAGMIWAVIPGLLRAYLGTSEVIVTIMMNYIIIYVTSFLLFNVMPKSMILPNDPNQTLHVGQLFNLGWMDNLTQNSSLNAGIFLVIIALLIMWVVFAKTTLGFEIRAVGLNPNASDYAGISAKRTIINSMLIAGALSGLAGVVYGFAYQGVGNFVYQSASLDIGFNGMAVALLGENNPIGILVAGVLFGILQTGAPGMQRDNIPPQIVSIVTAMIIFFVAIKFVIEHILPAVKEKKTAANVVKKGGKSQ